MFHRLHPLVKAVWLLVGTVFLFAVHSPWAILAVLVVTLLAFPAARLTLGRVWGIRTFTVTALLLAMIQILFIRTGSVLFQTGVCLVTIDGIKAGVYVAARFLSVIFLSYLFVLTTDPNDLAYSLMQMGVPYRYGFLLITALRLVAVFEREGQIVYQAQLARGVRYDTRSLRRFLNLARQFFLPMLVSALSKVDALAISMEGRCFGKYPSRTFLRETSFTRQDAAATGLLLLVIVAAVSLPMAP